MAFEVFARRGYDQACVQEIADQAGVAKPTVYNHLTDKPTLLREAMRAAADSVARNARPRCNRCASPVRIRAPR